MDNERLDRLEKTIAEMSGRNLMHEILLSHLLGSLGSATGNIGQFVNGVLANARGDIVNAGKYAPDEKSATRFGYALASLDNFSDNMQGSLRHIQGSGLN